MRIILASSSLRPLSAAFRVRCATDTLVAPLRSAVDRVRSRTPVASPLTSAEWERVRLAMRERSLFSATVENIRVLSDMKDKLLKSVSMQREQLANGKEAFIDRRSFISDLRKIAQDEGLTPADPRKVDTIQDITSTGRLGLVYDIQTQQAAGYARWQSEQSEGALDEFPAQELVRLEDRRDKRNWLEVWRAHGGRVFPGAGLDGRDGRMIALKTDPIWSRISRFGTPWPPFDFGSGVGLEEISREDAEDLGLIEPTEKLAPSESEFNDTLEASAEGFTESDRDELRDVFGDQVGFQGEKVVWQGNLVGDLADKALAQPAWKKEVWLGRASEAALEAAGQAGADLRTAELRINADDIRHIARRHGAAAQQPGQMPITLADFEMTPHIWRDPDEVVTGRDPTSWLFRKQFARGLLEMVIGKRSQGPKRSVYRIASLRSKSPKGAEA